MDPIRKETMAAVVAMQRQQVPRRHLKRALRECGMEATADALDHLLDEFDGLGPADRKDIEQRIEKYLRERESAGRVIPAAELEHDDWLIAENVAGDRTYVIYRGEKGHGGGFIGEVFDTAAEAPAGTEQAPLAEGQVLSNVEWEDLVPPLKERHRLYSKARAAMRLYDSQLPEDK